LTERRLQAIKKLIEDRVHTAITAIQKD